MKLCSSLLISLRPIFVIIDDDPTNVALIESVLQKAGFVNLHRIDENRRALSTVKVEWPDLVLLDLHIADPDGFEVIRQLRELVGQDTYLPILVFTSDTSTALKNKALAMGAKDFLSLPVDSIEMVLRVRNLLETRFLYQKLSELVAAQDA